MSCTNTHRTTSIYIGSIPQIIKNHSDHNGYVIMARVNVITMILWYELEKHSLALCLQYCMSHGCVNFFLKNGVYLF